MLQKAYETYADMLYRLALSHLHHREDAEDAVQEAFIKYHHKAGKFQDEEHERAWLIRVTVNICYDMLRFHKRREHVDLDEIAEQVSVEAPEELGVFHKLDQLSDKFKTVMVLHYLEGFSVEEVGRILHLSTSAVKMRLSRGRDQLREKLGEE